MFATASIIFGASFTAPTAEAGLYATCSIRNALLHCGADLKKGQFIMNTLGHPSTLKMLENAGKNGLIYSNGKEREAFRKSLEANRAAMKKYADKSWQQYRRRKMSAGDYEKIRAQYNNAMKSYQAAMDLYRAGTWQSSVQPKN